MAESGTHSKLKKAVVYRLDENLDPIEGSEIPVLFNPTEYSVDRSVTYADQSIPGFSNPLTQFVSGDAETLTMDLFFDTSEEGTDVRDHLAPFEELLVVDGDLHAPPVCRFAWGSFVDFTCVLQKATRQFTMFLPDGMPVRARANVTFKRYVPPAFEREKTPRKSADKTTVWTVKEGDSLWSIAAAEYGDPRWWRVVARANAVVNPRALRPGTELVVPPLEEADEAAG